ncbi:unnamed protein product [Moneuplotes crassus]|uniref:Uncharacterized protein n=1 Tax=Euplotes crassus TaxID=5936 RepID=A0AAD1XNK9_EUPCR|nr:unnamed protein product [Moneuplotes crassus]
MDFIVKRVIAKFKKSLPRQYDTLDTHKIRGLPESRDEFSQNPADLSIKPHVVMVPPQLDSKYRASLEILKDTERNLKGSKLFSKGQCCVKAQSGNLIFTRLLIPGLTTRSWSIRIRDFQKYYVFSKFSQNIQSIVILHAAKEKSLDQHIRLEIEVRYRT